MDSAAATWHIFGLSPASSHQMASGPDERHDVATADGWRLPLRRYFPRIGGSAGWPIVLCHGMGSNHLHLDWDETHGLAQHLARHGHDAFVVGLRGSRGSEPPAGHARWAFGFDELLLGDMPALTGAALELAGRERLVWLGHSMGGMLGLAAGAIPALAPRLAGRVGLAACACFAHYDGLQRWLPVARWLAGRFGDGLRIPRRVPARVEAWLLGWLRLPSLIAPVGLDPSLLGRLHAALTEDLPLSLIEQTVGWIVHDEFVSRDRAIDFRAALTRQTLPTLLLSGARDPWAPPVAVRQTADLLGTAADVEIVGRDAGASVDYGHTDLLFGPEAPREVFAVVARWLDALAEPHD